MCPQARTLHLAFRVNASSNVGMLYCRRTPCMSNLFTAHTPPGPRSHETGSLLYVSLCHFLICCLLTFLCCFFTFPWLSLPKGEKKNHTTVALVTNLLHLLCLRHRCGGRYWCKCAQVCACVCVCVCACVHVCTSSSSSSSIFLRLDLAGDAVASCNPPPTHPHACI